MKEFFVAALVTAVLAIAAAQLVSALVDAARVALGV